MPNGSRPTISDTARWVAALRAQESARPDAVFRDPYAARLAGDLGQKMAKSLSRFWGDTSWPVIARTAIIDEFLRKSIAEGVDRVLNLAAGLDTRPYRMNLPPSLTWIEADLPAMVEEKEQALSSEVPRCKLERQKVDLSDQAARTAFLDQALRGGRRALVLTEGLLVYLTADQVASLARDLRARTEVAYWVHDLQSPIVLKALQWATGSYLGENAQMKFGPADGVTFFAKLGWQPLEVRSMLQEARRLHRLPLPLRLASYVPEPPPESPGHLPWSAVVRYLRA